MVISCATWPMLKRAAIRRMGCKGSIVRPRTNTICESIDNGYVVAVDDDASIYEVREPEQQCILDWVHFFPVAMFLGDPRHVGREDQIAKDITECHQFH